MQIVELLQNEVFRFPPCRDRGQDIRVFLKGLFGEYDSLLSSVVQPDDFVAPVCDSRANIAYSGEELLEAIGDYFVGHQSSAYQGIATLLGRLRGQFDNLAKASRLGLSYKGTEAGFFRARIILDWGRPSRNDLFHVPFSHRERVSSQRFSVSGVPCLYLGSSTYLCWEELGRPEFGSMYVSYFKTSSPDLEAKFLSIGPAPAQLFRRISFRFKKGTDLIGGEDVFKTAAMSLAICWPLVSACSMQVAEHGPPFVPEYVVPQLVFHWVVNSGEVDGIEYPSMVVDHSRVWSDYGFNFALPVKSGESPDGLCPVLKRKFVMTEPVSWSLAQAFRDSPISTEEAIKRAGPGYWKDFGIADSVMMDYRYSEFGIVESRLRGMPLAPPG